MRGHIIKRYKGSYTIVLNLGVEPASGKRKQQWVSVKGTKKEAEKRLAELLHQIDTGTFMKPGKTTLAEYLERWLKDYVWPNLAPRTAEGYQYITRIHLIPCLGNILLTQLKPEHLQKYYSEKLLHGRWDNKGGLSPRSVRHHHMVLHCALQSAVKWGLIQRNPADAVTPPKAHKPEIQTWDEYEICRFLETTKESTYYPIFYLALFTGLRRSELLALRWQDVDSIYCQIYVSRSMHHLKTGELIFRQPKSTKGNRTVALSPSTIEMLREYREKRAAEAVMLEKPITDNDLVFCHPNGSPLLPDTISHAWDKAVRRAGLRVIRLHDARHTHASYMLKQGIHPKVVQERLGHSSIQVTLDTYSHVAPGIQEKAAARLDDVFKTERRNDPIEIVG
jgi:integrase